MIGGLGVTELLIVLVIVLILFGVGRIGKIGGELGSAIKNFRDGINSATADDADAEPETGKVK